MAISYVASSATDTSPFSADRTGVTFPSGTTTDDVIIVVFTTPNSHTLSTTTGWTQIGTTQTTATTGCTTSILYRVVDGTEGGSWDFTGIFSGAESGGVYTATYRGVDTADVVEANADTNTGTVTSVSGPSVTPINNNCMIMQILGGETAATAGAADTSPAANLRNNDDVSGGSGHSYTFHQDFLQSTAAALALDATSLTSTEYTAFQIALNEATAAGGTIDTIDTNVAQNTTGNFTTSGLNTIVTWRLTDADGNTVDTTGTQTTFDAPALADGQNVLTGTVELKLIDDLAVEATANFTLTVQANYHEVRLAAGFETGPASYLEGYGQNAEVGDPFFGLTADVTLRDDGTALTEGEITTTLFGMDRTDGLMESFLYETGPLQVSNDLTVSFETLTFVSDDLDVTFETLAFVSDDLTVTFDTLGFVTNDLTVSFDTLAFVTNDLDVTFDTLAFVSDDLTIMFDSMSHVSNDLTVQFETLGFVSSTLDIQWGFTAQPFTTPTARIYRV